METISLKMESSLLTGIDDALEKHRYSTRTEFIRDAIRDKLNDLEKEEVIRKLAAYKGRFHSPLSDEQMRDAGWKAIAKKLGVPSD